MSDSLLCEIMAAYDRNPGLAMNSSLAYIDAYRSERLPANLTQAQRDDFVAHTCRRIDKEGVFHTKWSLGKGMTG